MSEAKSGDRRLRSSKKVVGMSRAKSVGTFQSMVGYRRNRLEGGTFFFTVTLADRRSTVLIDQIGALRNSNGTAL
jgi:hypothetical protein